jgi:hypothetical protein
LRFSSSTILILVLLCAKSWAQKPDSLAKKDFRPTGIRLGTDLFSLVRSPLDESFYGWEATVDVDFYRYFIILERGQWKRDLASEDETYSNDGAYWRAGVDVNFLKKDPEKNMVFLGLRYAWGNFDEKLTVFLDDTWTAGTTEYVNTNTNSSWVEITGGLRVKVLKSLWLGYTIRHKLALNTNETSNLVPYDVPGYGRTDTSTTWGFNYYVLFRIPVRKSSATVKK